MNNRRTSPSAAQACVGMIVVALLYVLVWAGSLAATVFVIVVVLKALGVIG